MLKILHRWLGLTVGLILVVVSLSGSWLVYHREWREPDFLLNVQPRTIPIEHLYTKAVKELNAANGIVIRFPQKPELPYQFWSMGDDQQRLFVNQYTGEILAKHAPDYWPYGWIFELHTEFLAGHQGENALGIVGVLAVFISVIGVLLWLPKRGQRFGKHLKIRLNKNSYLRHFDLHRHIGILTAPLFILIFTTGITLVFNKEFSKLVNLIADSKISETPSPELNQKSGRVSLDLILESANAAMKDGRVGIVIIPSKNKPIIVRKQMPGDPHPNGLNFIHIDSSNGKVLQTITVAQADIARKLFNWIYPLHSGQAFRGWYEWLLFIVGFIPTLLLLTASITFYLRTLKTKST